MLMQCKESSRFKRVITRTNLVNMWLFVRLFKDYRNRKQTA